MNYYYLIAGLPDLYIEDTKLFLPLLDFKKELLVQLAPSDIELIKLLFAKYDNQNFLLYLANKEAELNPLGNLTSEDWQQLITLMKETEHPNDKRLLPYIQQFYAVYYEEEFWSEGISKEDYLSTLYYEYAMNNNNDFLKSWFEFNLNINNILVAVACRKYGIDQKKVIVGNNEIAQILRTTNARDFGLTNIFENLETLLQIAEETDLLQREKEMDAFKWKWLEENTFFHYFSVEKILAFVIKMEILERWQPLSVEKGTQIFRTMVNHLKESVNFEEEANVTSRRYFR